MVTQANKVSGGFMDSLGFFGGARRAVYWRWYAKYSSDYIWSPVATKHNEEFVAGSPENGLFNFTYKNGIRTPVLIWTVMLGRMINRLQRIKGHGRRKDNA